MRGSLLFTHFGLSGPAALDLSRSWLRAEDRGERVVRVSFVPGATREELLADWAAAAGAEPKLTVRRWLGRRLPDRLAVVLCAEVGVGPARYASQVERERRAELVERLCARPLRVSGTLGYEKAEVTAGGVALDEVDASTLESRKAPGRLPVRRDARRGRQAGGIQLPVGVVERDRGGEGGGVRAGESVAGSAPDAKVPAQVAALRRVLASASGRRSRGRRTVLPLRGIVLAIRR